MEQHRDTPLELVVGLREDVAEVRSDVRHLQSDFAHLRSDFAELRTDFRRLDDRLSQLLLLQVGTLATVAASLVTALVAVLAT